VNSPFQRFKRNLLLLLQILLLALLVLAAMQPLWRRSAERATRIPILIDVSASMGAIDSPNGASRLTMAKRRVRDLIEGVASDQELCLIAFASAARRLTPFTNNRRDLHAALDALEVEDVPSDIEEALRLAQALGRSTRFERVILVSDGNLPPRANFELSFAVDYQRIEGTGANCGITALNARRGLGQRWDLFIEVGSSLASETSGGVVEIIRAGNVIATEPVIVRKGSSTRLTLNLPDAKEGLIMARFVPNGFDALASDNTAFLEVPEVRPLEVWAAESLPAFRHALAAMDGVRLNPESGLPTSAGYDLAFVDRETDLSLAARVLCTVGFVPAELQPLLTIQSASTAAVDWRRESPLLQHVTFRDVVIMDEPTRAPNTTDADFAARGYDILVHGAHGPLMIEKQERDQRRIHLLFHPDHSTLPYRVGFPVMISNLVQAALAASHLAEAGASPTGVLPPLKLRPNTAYQVKAPHGHETTMRSDAHGDLRGVIANRVGTYVIRGGGDDVQIGASVLSADETSLRAVDAIELNDQLQIKAATHAALQSDRPLWWPLSLIGFIVLLVEWWFYHRRHTAVAT
jgi:hypothetical protein